MPEDLSIRKIKGGFRLRLGPFATNFFWGPDTVGVASFSAETFLGRKSLAHLEGTIVGDRKKLSIDHFFSEKRVSEADGLRGLAVLSHSASWFLKSRGIKKAGVSTHENFARFLEQMGWKITTERGGLFDVEKSLKGKLGTPAIVKKILSSKKSRAVLARRMPLGKKPVPKGRKRRR